MAVADFGVIFDMDGVIIDSEPLTIASYLEAFRDFGVELTRQEYISRVVVTGTPVRRLFAENGGDLAKWKQLFARKTEIYSKMVENQLHLRPGARELLEDLKIHKVPTALATSASKATVEIVFKRFDISPYFDAVVTLDDVVNQKPSPEAFLKAAAALKLDPQNCIVIEDAPKGINAAKSAGMKCIAVPTELTCGEDLAQADFCAESLAQLNTSVIFRIINKD